MMLEQLRKGAMGQDFSPRHSRASAPEDVDALPQVIQLIGAASAIGARDKGCALGPDVLRQAKIEETLRSRHVTGGWYEILRRPHARGVPTDISALRDFCGDLAQAVAATLRPGHKAAVVGGDHACAIGTWSAASLVLQGRGPLGLIWIDAHMDSHTPATSPSGAAHGMPLAVLLGHGHPTLTQLITPGPKLLPGHVCLIGVRSFEEAEARLLQRLGVQVIFMDEIEQRGLDWAMRRALAIVTAGTAGFGVSIDMDAIDPTDAPGVGTPAPGGLRGQELTRCLRLIAHHPGLVGVEIAEFNPLHDREDKTLMLVRDLIQAVFADPPEDTYAPRD